VAPGTGILVSTPCHLKPYVKFSCRRLSDTLHPPACTSVTPAVPSGSSTSGHSAAPRPRTPLGGPLQRPAITDPTLDLDRQHRVPRAALGPIPVRARQDVRREQRLDDAWARLLDAPLAKGRNPPRARATIGRGDLPPPHRAGAIPWRLQVLAALAAVGLDPVAFNVLTSHAIDARAPPVRSHLPPGPPPHIGPHEAVG
jgi:hypothetical protein